MMNDSERMPMYRIKDENSDFSAYIRYHVGFKRSQFLLHELVLEVMKTIKSEQLFDEHNPYIIVTSYPMERAIGVPTFLQSNLQAILRPHLDCIILDPAAESSGLEFAEALRLKILENARGADTLIPISAARVSAPYAYAASLEDPEHVVMCLQLFKILHPGTCPSSNFFTIAEITSQIINYLKARGKVGSTKWNNKIFNLQPSLSIIFKFRYVHETQIPFMLTAHTQTAKPESKTG